MSANNEILNLLVLLKSKYARNTTVPEASLIEVGDTDLNFTLGGIKGYSLPKHWRGLLLLDNLNLSIEAGDASCYSLNLTFFAKLLAFADEAGKAEMAKEYGAFHAMIGMDKIDVLRDRHTAESWFIQLIYENSHTFSPFFTLLRRTEYYALVRFLLAQSLNGGNLHDLGESYGVSYSHFRRLCHQALGATTKMELRRWRMARALLDASEKGHSFTEVAFKHGYASSSHFSNEVRALLGVSPRGLSDIVSLAIK